MFDNDFLFYLRNFASPVTIPKLGIFLLLLLPFTLITLFITYADKIDSTALISFVKQEKCSFEAISVCQYGGKGTNGTFLYILYNSVGFGSEINQLLLAFAYSVASKRQFLIDTQHWNYGRFEDYFDLGQKPFHRSIPYEFLVEDEKENRRHFHLKTTRTGKQLEQFWRATRHVQTIGAKRSVAHYFWNRMNRTTSRLIRQCRMKSPSKFISIHIRRGDKNLNEARLIPVIGYIRKIEQILGNQTQTVFISSDVPQVIEECRQIRPQWTFFDRELNTTHEKNISFGHRQGEFNRLPMNVKFQQTVLLLCQLQFFIDADYVFCTMSSNICRLIQILRHAPIKTTISLDVGWRGN